MRKNELITGADSRPRIHIRSTPDGYAYRMGIGPGMAASGVRFRTPGAALDAALDDMMGDQAVIILGAVPGVPGEG